MLPESGGVEDVPELLLQPRREQQRSRMSTSSCWRRPLAHRRHAQSWGAEGGAKVCGSSTRRSSRRRCPRASAVRRPLAHRRHAQSWGAEGGTEGPFRLCARRESMLARSCVLKASSNHLSATPPSLRRRRVRRRRAGGLSRYRLPAASACRMKVVGVLVAVPGVRLEEQEQQHHAIRVQGPPSVPNLGEPRGGGEGLCFYCSFAICFSSSHGPHHRRAAGL